MILFGSVTLSLNDVLSRLNDKIQHIDWDEAKKDIARFLQPRELSTLELWSKNFFYHALKKLKKL